MQIKAATNVKHEMLVFYWSLGKDIVEMKADGDELFRVSWGNTSILLIGKWGNNG